MATYQIGYFVGSLSSKSINRILSKALIRLAPHDLEFNEIPIGNLPLYSPDYDEDYPPEATALKEAIAGSDAVLFVTPEYNRSIPGALKNAIDWASRPWGKLLRSHSGCRDRRTVGRARFLSPRRIRRANRNSESRRIQDCNLPDLDLGLRVKSRHSAHRGSTSRRCRQGCPSRPRRAVSRTAADRTGWERR
jgi:hypothetical protein